MSSFIKGKKLSKMFYNEVVKLILQKHFPDLKYAAALIGSGSEVLGFDTERSTDHHWGPRVILFLEENDYSLRGEISKVFSEELPSNFHGYSTHFGEPDQIGVQLLTDAKEGQSINHRVEIFTVEDYFKEYLGVNPYKKLTSKDWLTFSEQKLKTIKNGNVFYDVIGFKDVKKKFDYYPNDVWLFLLASEWEKISQEEPFVGRSGEVDDELGSMIIAARLVKSVMNLCFMMEKVYIPYSKWFGTAFLKLNLAKEMTPILSKILEANNWKEREKYLSKAYEFVAEMHNNLKITKPVHAKVSYFHDRPFYVIQGGDFAQAIKDQINDKTILKIRSDIGSVNQITNTVDLLENNLLLKRMKILYD
ncbi:MAG: DUF4037 domain-containing protein [Bacteroidota bacterium]